MTAVDEVTSGDRPPQLRSLTLFGAALQLIGAHAAALALIALVGVAVVFGLLLGGDALAIAWNKPGPSLGYFGFELVRGSVLAAIGGIVLRVLLGPPPGGGFRLDRGFAAFVGLSLLGYMASTAPNLVLGDREPSAASFGPYLLRQALGLALLVATLFATLRLMLWPAAIRMGRWDVSPARSWRLMEGVTGGAFGANITAVVCFALPVLLVGVILGARANIHPDRYAAMSAVATLILDVFAYAVVAAVYRARVLGDPLPEGPR